MLIFIDTETTGLPLKRDRLIYQLSNWPRLVEIAWIECNDNGEVIAEYNKIIKPESFEIPQSASAIHGITTAKAMVEGVPINQVLKDFHKSFTRSSLIIGHNVDFDAKVINTEYIRKGFLWQHFQFLWKRKKCTMKSSTKICRIKTGHGYYKYPTLSELHTKLFGRSYDQKHEALRDVRACMKCYFELKRRNKI